MAGTHEDDDRGRDAATSEFGGGFGVNQDADLGSARTPYDGGGTRSGWVAPLVSLLATLVVVTVVVWLTAR